jgi:putative FmdB family regulatory protein
LERLRVMPNYDFKCNTCGTMVEVQDPTPTGCTTCGYTMERVWTAPAIKFNGTGFYSTGG